jgi:flagellar basal-body rod protein FlgC
MNVSSIAASGLAAASLRLQVSASNVANMLDTGPLPGTSNTSKFSAAYVPLRVDQVATAGGGTAATTAPVSPSYLPQYDPGAPFADQNGLVAAPNVDLANEAVQQIIARYEFTANTKVMQVNAQMMQSLLNITA